MNQPIYLDHAASTPLDPRVLTAMEAVQDVFYNPSATYLAARSAGQHLQAARKTIAHWLGCSPAEVISTAGGSEANNLAIHGIMRQYPTGNVVLSAIEHDSVRVPAARYSSKEVSVTPDGRLDLNSLTASIDDKTVLVSIMQANNEIGTIQPIREVAQIVQAIRKERQKTGNTLPIYVHTDACQAANYLDLHVSRLGVDLMTINGSKLYGPKQTGVLYVRGGVQLQPLIDGGGQERGLRSGTENLTGMVGFVTALGIAQEMRHEEAKRLQQIQQLFYKTLQEKIPGAIINGSQKYRLPNNLHVTLPGQDNERLLMQLDEVGIMAAAGSACSASSEESSHVLHALGLDDAAARASLRLTMGRSTNADMIDQLIDQLHKFTAA